MLVSQMNLGEKILRLTYDQLKKLNHHPQNRIVREASVKKILAAIERGEKIAPVIINRRTMVMVDGQHRVAAWILFVENHPEIKSKFALNVVAIDVSQEEEFALIIRTNSKNVKWVSADYLNAFANAGNENYVRLRNFVKKCNLCHGNTDNDRGNYVSTPKITNAIGLINGHGTQTALFKNGELEVTAEEIKVAETRAKQVETILENVDPKHTICTRSINYLISTWVHREKIDVGINADMRLSWIVTHKKECQHYIKESGNKLVKQGDWHNLFNFVAQNIYSSQKKGYTLTA